MISFDKFLVDATNAGYGNLEIGVIDHDDVMVQSKVTPQENSNAKYFVSFVPVKPGDYVAHITFNGENLKGEFQLSTRRFDVSKIIPFVTFNFKICMQ